MSRGGFFGLSLLVWAGACARPSEKPTVAFLGDSLTSGYRLPAEEAYPAVLAKELGSHGRQIRTLNAGVNGNTAAEGLARLPGVLATRPDVLVVALGVNDGLRGIDPTVTEASLRRIIEEARRAGVAVLLIGMRIAPEDGGVEFARRFNDLYPRLAAENRLPFVPDLLTRVRGEPGRPLREGLHPNAQGQRLLAETVRPVLELVLAEREALQRARRPDRSGG